MRLARTERVGPATYRRLLRRFSTAGEAIAALPELAQAGGGSAPALIGAGLAAREFERAARFGAKLLFVDEDGYPPLLGLLHDAPPVIAVLGDVAVLSAAAVAVVGSRNASANGRTMAEALAEALAAHPLPVVSGLARGIDAAAHEGALRAGATIAAVAGGLDKPYPPEHADLQARIAASGAVVSEAPFGTSPQARHFPRRNRIIAGLALGVVVIEAAQRSGSLITARLALECGRELFAVPGSPLDPRCRGSNDLIRQGAHLTETAEDVFANLPAHPLQQGVQRVPLFNRDLWDDLEATHMAEPRTAWEAPESEAEFAAVRRRLEGLLSPSPTLVDDLIARCQVSPAAVNAILLELELAGRVSFLTGPRVALIAPGEAAPDGTTLDEPD
jgi:DNA processing protein